MPAATAIDHEPVPGKPKNWRLVVAIVAAVPATIVGFLASDVVALVSGSGCAGTARAWGLGIIAMFVAVTGGVPSLIAGRRKAALVPLAIGAGGASVFFFVLLFSNGHGPDC